MRTLSCDLLLLLHIFAISLLFSRSSRAYSDLELLLKLKSSMIGPSGSGLDDWVSDSSSSSPTSHCSFSGVSCDEHSRVTSLKISSLPLFGTIPPEIGLFTSLINLTLVADNLTGHLPIEMSKLTVIKFINLSSNTFIGEFPGEVVATMSELESLDVYNNNFTGKLPTEFAKLKKLKTLHLGGNFFYGEIPEAFTEIQSLESLGLQGNELTGTIPASLARLSNLQELCLGYFNQYEGGIPHELGLMTNLRLLDLGGCNVSGEIPASLSNLKMLHTLFLQFNQLTGLIPPELSGLVSLKSLDLSVNFLTGEIPKSFSELQNLTLINLFRNNLEGPIPSFIGDLPNLEVLQIWENNFTLELPANLGRNGKLLRLDVATNHLTGTIPRDLCGGGRLETLILMENYFVGPIPEELGECKSLNRVRLVKNFFSGTIPAGFFNMPFLEMLELSDNLFTGELPSEISGKALSIVSVSVNKFTGKVPPAIGNLVNLVNLALDENQFSGEIPEQIFNLKNLTSINLSGNNISGGIPSSITDCKSLTSIDFSQNDLYGEIPVKLTRLINLGILNLSRNHLTGPIPVEMASMASLTKLDLSYNDLSGRIPTTGQFQAFNSSSFAGNSKLCTSRNQSYCPILQNPTSSSTNRHTASFGTAKLIIAVIGVVTVVLCLVVTFVRVRQKRVVKSRAWRLTTFQRLDFKAEDVLECLKEENIIGKGGAGIVYRGSMPDGLDVAIKRLIGRGSGRSDHGFSAEIQTLGKIRHRNIVRLLGYVSNKDTNLLLYEYMRNGSLGEILHGCKGAHLQWEARYRIAVEAAKGLSYLHHDCSPLIIHRDVKSNNILLDSDYEAHVADFGLAKFLENAGASECMSSIAGSYGYIAPEYAYTLKVDEKSDVYSFGVVLLELITGRKPVGEFGEGVDIVRWVKKTISELTQPSDTASVLAVVDQRLNGYPLPSVMNLFKIAMMCVEEESVARPTMREVVHMLTNPPQSAPNLGTL